MIGWIDYFGWSLKKLGGCVAHLKQLERTYSFRYKVNINFSHNLIQEGANWMKFQGPACGGNCINLIWSKQP